MNFSAGLPYKDKNCFFFSFMTSLHIFNVSFSKQSPKNYIYVKIEYPLHIEEEQYFICRYTLCSLEFEKQIKQNIWSYERDVW